MTGSNWFWASAPLTSALERQEREAEAWENGRCLLLAEGARERLGRD